MSQGERQVSNPTVSPLTPVIGAEIGNVDLSQPLDEATFVAIREAFEAYQVIFFRDQDISVERLKELGERFGELVAHPNDPGLEGHPEVMIIHADASSKRVAGETWHSDVSCDEEPPMGSILRLFIVPETGGDTLFASMYAAYEALSEPMKDFLQGLTAIHDGAPYYRRVNALLGRQDGGRDYPRAEHPLVRTHPVTGEKAIFVNELFTTGLVGLSQAEADAILGFLFRHVQRGDFQCRFRWRKNSMAFWDNRCTQHLAIWDYFPETRSGYRVTMKGDRPS